MNLGNGDAEVRGEDNLDLPISTNAHHFADESNSVNREDQVVVQRAEAGPLNVKNDNSNFHEIHGNATTILFGDGQFTEAQRNLICDYIANLAILPDINHDLNKRLLVQPIINLPRAEAVFDDYQTKKKSEPCFEGTRVALLLEMAEWVTGLDESRMYVLSGLAGIGKTTIAYTIASRAAHLNLLGASFFFSRDENDRNNAKKFFTTIAYQLCLYNETFYKTIGDVLQTQRGSAIMKGPQEQLQTLIVEPLQSIVQSRVRPILIVVDALDECDEEDALSVLTGLKQLVRALRSFKVILTTQPQPHFDHFFGRQDGHEIFYLQDIEDKIVDGDIRLYLNHRLSLEKVQERLPTSQWCASDKEVDVLVRAAGRSFIIASTVVRIILDNVVSNPAAQIQRLLGTFVQDYVPFKNINDFYTVILQNIIPADCDVNIVNRYQSVVGAIISVQHPLPITTLAHLINISVEEIHAVLVNFQSVILLGDDDIPRVYHRSFPDCVTDMKLCQDIKLCIDPIMRHMQITIHCFQIMEKYLKRNILGLGDPARFTNNKDGLKMDGITDEQIQEKIPQQLHYACVYWAHHLEVAKMIDKRLTQGLERFADEHMVYWLEVLSLIGKLDSARRAIGVVLNLLTSTSSNLHRLFSDASHFISRFYDIIERSALHIYHSALPFTPIDSLLYRRYIKEANHNMCSIEGGPEEKWSSLVANLSHGEDIQVVKFSLDSTLLASCSDEHVDEYMNAQGKLKIWDAATGEHISAIPGHKFAVANDFSTVVSSQDNIATLYNVNGSPSDTMFTTSSKIQALAISSESSRVAAGLCDGTVWLWDSRNARLIDKLDGFDGSKNSSRLEFSRSGTRLAYSGYSWEIGIKLRDGISGRVIADLKCGQIDEFKFSADGSRIAYRSHDSINNLELWNSKNGRFIGAGRNVRHHTFAISANGFRLATAYNDKVTLWGEKRIELTKIKVLQVDGPLSIAFSLGNMLAIATRSGIKMYNIKTRSFVHKLPLGESHIPPAFSPDCTRLAIGDRSNDVNLWDIRDIDAPGSSSKENAPAVTALTLSRDCSRLACGFGDGTVELWGTSPTKRRIGLALRSKMEKFLIRIFRQSRQPVCALEFNPDGKLCASVSGDRTIKLWNGRDGVLRGTLKVSSKVQAVALSNSVLVAAYESGGVALWNLDTLSPIHTFEISNDTAFKVSISENSTLIAACLRSSHVTLFDAVNRTTICTFNVPSLLHTMTFLPDNSQLVLQSFKGDFQSFNLVNKHTTDGPTLEHLVQLPNTPLWHGVPVWHCENKEQHYFAALFPQYQSPVPVLWIPKQIPVTTWTQGSSMIALGCKDGRVILLRLPTSGVS